MMTQNIPQTLTMAVESLSTPESLKGLFHKHRDGNPLPSAKALEEIISLAREIIFPGYYGKTSVSSRTIKYHIGVNMERLHKLLTDQVLAGLCFSQEEDDAEDRTLPERAEAISVEFISKLADVRKVLATDVEAEYNGDPAAKSQAEIILCYPVVKAMTNYRIAHELYELGVPLIPRMITEMAHSETGIDIHPAARIGHHFAIDHGTGVVIGATCIIGNNVKIYQGVTLGAKSFALDENGNPIKGVPRHPILEDNVVVYSNATILGRITIGEGAVVGANVWVTEDMLPNSKKVKSEK